MTDDWKHISTAPKNGVVILLCDTTPIEQFREVLAGYYDAEQPEFKWRFLDGTHELNGWRDDDTGPTRWRPLPPPPTNDQ